jgi:hypothetical protein
LIFNFCLGIRDILLHQKSDQSNDIKSGINSFAIQYKTKIRFVTYALEFIASLSLIVFLTISFWKIQNDIYLGVVLGAYFILFLFQLFRVQQSIDNNDIIRFYVAVTSLSIANWLIEENQHAYLVLLVHPYIIQFFTRFLVRPLLEIKNFIALIANYLLYYAFKLGGRDLKKRPLYKKRK